MTEPTINQGPVLALAVSPHFDMDGICFAAHASGLYRSSDAGSTWQYTYETLGSKAALVTAVVAISPSFARDKYVFAGVSGGILRSTDSGLNWQMVVLPPPPPFVSSLVVSPDFERDGTIFAGTLEDGIYCSRDRGDKWFPCAFGLTDLKIQALAISPNYARDETLFAGTESGIFRSTNGGRAWQEANFPMEYAPVLCLAVSPGYVTDRMLFAGTEASGLLRSSDEGLSWTRLGREAIYEDVNSIVLSPQFPAKPNILVVLNEVLLISRDNGETWANWNPNFDSRPGLASLVAPRGLDPGAPLIIGLMEGGVVRI